MKTVYELIRHPEADHDWLMLASSAKHIPPQDKLVAASTYGPWLLRFPQLWDTPELAQRAIDTVAKNAPQELTSLMELLAHNYPNLRLHTLNSYGMGELPEQTVAKWFHGEQPFLKAAALASSPQQLLHLLAQEDWHKHDEGLLLWEALQRNQHISPEILDVIWSKLNPKNSQDYVLAKKVLEHPLFKPKEDLAKVLDKAAAVFATDYNKLSERGQDRLKPWLQKQPEQIKLHLKLNPMIIPNLKKDSLTLKKSESAQPKPRAAVSPVNPLDDDLALEIAKAFNTNQVHAIKLDGQYSKGSKLAQINGKVYLLKGEPVQQDEISGSQEQPATPAQREAAFPKMAQSLLKGDSLSQAFLPAALIQSGQHIYAVMEWKGGKGTCTLDELYRDKPELARKLVDPMMQRGDLHKLAAIDYLFGNGDRHGNNVMTDGKNIYMIDHAGAFAGKDFSPATDQSSFVPFYLRMGIDPKVNYNELSPAAKFNALSVANLNANRDIRAWLYGIDMPKLVEQAKLFGIEPSGLWHRYEQLLQAVRQENASQGINRLWALGR